MKNLTALTASIAVNLAMFGALDFSAFQAAAPPAGEVSVTQLPMDADVSTYASTVDAVRRQTVL